MDDDRVQRNDVRIARLEERLAAHAEALTLARRSIDERLAGLNELREQLREERSQYVSQAAYTARHEDLERRLTKLERWQSNVTGRAVGLGVIGALFIAVVAAVITHIIA